METADRPYIYQIEPTNHCPYTCIMCPRGLGRMSRAKGFMEMETLETALEDIHPEQKFIRLHHFGEAVLHPEIDVMIRKVKEKGLYAVVSLNPATMSDSITEKILEAGGNIVCFSLDTLSDNGLKKIRGVKKSFRENWATIESFIEESRKRDPFVLKVIQMVRLDLNRHEWEEFTQLKIRYPESDIFFHLADNNGFGDPELVEKTLCGGKEAVLKNASACVAPFTEISILWDGSVVLCCFDYDGFTVIGNIREDPLNDIWHGETVGRLRKLFEKRRTQGLKLCGGCFLAPHRCHGAEPYRSRGWEEDALLLDLYLTACRV